MDEEPLQSTAHTGPRALIYAGRRGRRGVRDASVTTRADARPPPAPARSLRLQEPVGLAHPYQDVQLLRDGQLPALARDLGQVLLQMPQLLRRELKRVPPEQRPELMHRQQHKPAARRVAVARCASQHVAERRCGGVSSTAVVVYRQ